MGHPYRDAIRQAQADLAEIDKKLDGYKRLMQQKAKLETYIAITQSLLDAAEGGVQTTLPAAEHFKLTNPKRRRLWEYIAEAMKDRTQPFSAKDALDVLVSQNIEVRGEHKVETVRGALLGREDVFQKDEHGKFLVVIQHPTKALAASA